FSFTNVPLSTNSAHNRSYSPWEPSHHTTRSGFVSRAISATQSRSFRWRTQSGAANASDLGVWRSFIKQTPGKENGPRLRPGRWDPLEERFYRAKTRAVVTE